jgi:hypothetical protein
MYRKRDRGMNKKSDWGKGINKKTECARGIDRKRD